MCPCEKTAVRSGGSARHSRTRSCSSGPNSGSPVSTQSRPAPVSTTVALENPCQKATPSTTSTRSPRPVPSGWFDSTVAAPVHSWSASSSTSVMGNRPFADDPASGTIHGVTNTWDIAGKTVVITGASDGIGAVAARKLAAQGADVVIVGRSADKLARVADTVRDASGQDPLTFVADFTSLDEVRKLAADLLDRLPNIHVLANNAGGVWP